MEADPLGLASHHEIDRSPPLEPPAQRAALLRLLAVIAGTILVAYLAGVTETVLLILALFACIVLHEFGHFLMAKWAGIKVTEFFVGFGPRLWSVRRGETEYGVKGLPLGGYCRIIGMSNLEEVDPADEDRTYRQKSLWRRLSVVSAGSAMHFLIALVVLFSMFFWTGDNSNYLGSIPSNNPVVALDGLKTGPSPAEQAGFEVGDRIVAINGRHFKTWDLLSADIQANPGRRLDVTVERAGRLVHLFPTPVDRSKVGLAGPAAAGVPAVTKPTGFLGIEIDPVVHSSLGASISEAGGAWVHVSAGTLHALGRLASFQGVHSYFHMLSSQQAADSPTNQVRFTSPVGIVRDFHQAGQDGLATVLYLLAVVNISLGIFNLVPLLPLDGGHVAIALYEGVRSRPRRRYHADVAKLLPIFYVAMALIIFLGVSSLFLDLRDLIS